MQPCWPGNKHRFDDYTHWYQCGVFHVGYSYCRCVWLRYLWTLYRWQWRWRWYQDVEDINSKVLPIAITMGDNNRTDAAMDAEPWTGPGSRHKCGYITKCIYLCNYITSPQNLRWNVETCLQPSFSIISFAFSLFIFLFGCLITQAPSQRSPGNHIEPVSFSF